MGDIPGDERAVGYLSSILNARVYDVVKETPLELAVNMSQELSNNIFLKREDMNTVKSFKIRGAYNKMVQLPRSKLERGVIACSAGNHAQGVAMSASYLGCRAVIVMPLATPRIKVDAVRTFGGATTEVCRMCCRQPLDTTTTTTHTGP